MQKATQVNAPPTFCAGLTGAEMRLSGGWRQQSIQMAAHGAEVWACQARRLLPLMHQPMVSWRPTSSLSELSTLLLVSTGPLLQNLLCF